MCNEIDAIMMGEPDSNPALTARQLRAIEPRIIPSDAALLENVAEAYSALTVNPNDVAAQQRLSNSATALGSGCQMATGVPNHP
ncbi:MAG: hypothetical protein ACKOI2_10445 [Actinomycetota bacterium]